MKTIRTIISILILASGAVKAQNKNEGVITYEQVVNLHANLTKEQMIFKSVIPEFQKSTMKLTFKDGNYRLEQEEAKKSGEGEVKVVSNSLNSTVIVRNDRQKEYRFYKKGTKTYYTEEKIEKATLTVDKKSTKKILGYVCYKAIYKGSDKEIYELWITNELKLSCNPFLPGLADGVVLEIKSKKLSYTAKKIEFNAQDAAQFDVTASDKKITRDQAEDMQEEFLQEVQQK